VSKHSACATSYALTPTPSEFGRDVVNISYHGRSFGLIIVSGARLESSSFRKNFPWLGQ